MAETYVTGGRAASADGVSTTLLPPVPSAPRRRRLRVRRARARVRGRRPRHLRERSRSVALCDRAPRIIPRVARLLGESVTALAGQRARASRADELDDPLGATHEEVARARNDRRRACSSTQPFRPRSPRARGTRRAPRASSSFGARVAPGRVVVGDRAEPQRRRDRDPARDARVGRRSAPCRRRTTSRRARAGRDGYAVGRRRRWRRRRRAARRGPRRTRPDCPRRRGS